MNRHHVRLVQQDWVANIRQLVSEPYGLDETLYIMVYVYVHFSHETLYPPTPA